MFPGRTITLTRLILVGCLGVMWATVAHGEQNRPAPDVTGDAWINTVPLELKRLRGNVVLVEFWTFGCINCRNVEPYVKAWHEQYADQGFIVIGVHTPEFAYEKKLKNVKRYVSEQHGLERRHERGQ